MMLETWLFELLKGIGRLFLHPLLYWTVLLLILTSYKRIKRERYDFGSKIFDMFTESKNTFTFSILFSVIVSLFSISFGFIMSYEVIAILCIVTILLSITGSLSMLSASYTIGITFLIVLILPYVQLDFLQGLVIEQHMSIVYLISLAILTGLFLLIESLLVSSKKYQTFPTIALSDRGKWVGQHHLKRLAFIPFFAFIPVEQVGAIAPLFPYFQYGDQTFSLILLPFIIGFDYKVQGDLPFEVSQKLGKYTFVLSTIVLLIAVSSLFYPVLAIVAILVAIIGKEWITFRHRTQNRKKQAFFSPVNDGLKVLAIYPNSPAERLDIQVGEVIHKVNDIRVNDSKDFYEALQQSGPFFKLDILDYQGEVRFVKSAFYEADHHELGIIFPEVPHQAEREEKIG